MLTLVRRVRALDAPAAGVGVTRAIRTLGIVAHRPSALGRGVCCCRCGSEIGHGLVGFPWFKSEPKTAVLAEDNGWLLSFSVKAVLMLFK